MTREREVITRGQLIDWLDTVEPQLFKGARVNEVRIGRFTTSYLALTRFLAAKGTVQYHPALDDNSKPLVFQKMPNGNAVRTETALPTDWEGKLVTYGGEREKMDDGTKQVRIPAALMWKDANGNTYINAEVAADGRVVGAGVGVLVCHAWSGTVLGRGRAGRRQVVEFTGFKFGE